MEWSEDLGGIKLRISRDANSPEDIIVEFDVRDRDLLVKKPKLKIEFVTQRLKSKWQGLVLRGGNKDKKTAFNGQLPIDTFRQTLELKNTPFFDFSGEDINPASPKDSNNVFKSRFDIWRISSLMLIRAAKFLKLLTPFFIKKFSISLAIFFSLGPPKIRIS